MLEPLEQQEVIFWKTLFALLLLSPASAQNKWDFPADIRAFSFLHICASASHNGVPQDKQHSTAQGSGISV